MSTKPPADPPMDRSANPVRPATAPNPRKPAVPPAKSGFQRFMLQLLLLVIALGGAFGTGYLVNANEVQLDRNNLLQQQLEAEERIRVLEQQIAELRESRASGNRVELDLTEVFEPIREAVGRIALVRMGEISREITTELTRLVEDDLAPGDDPANATGVPTPGGMSNGSASRTPGPEAASAAGGAAPPQSGGPDSLQPDSAAVDATAADQPEAIELVGNEPESNAPAAATPAPAASTPPSAPPAPAADIRGLPATSEEAASQDASRSVAPALPAGGSGIELADGSTRQERTNVAALVRTPHPPGPAASAPTTVP